MHVFTCWGCSHTSCPHDVQHAYCKQILTVICVCALHQHIIINRRHTKHEVLFVVEIWFTIWNLTHAVGLPHFPPVLFIFHQCKCLCNSRFVCTQQVHYGGYYYLHCSPSAGVPSLQWGHKWWVYSYTGYSNFNQMETDYSYTQLPYNTLSALCCYSLMSFKNKGDRVSALVQCTGAQIIFSAPPENLF